MWKKDDTTPDRAEPTNDLPRRTQERSPSAPRTQAASPAEQAAIGPSITIRGDVTGDEDLLIQGTVEGSIDLGDHAVAVGREGRVKANITGRIVTVEGEVEGDLLADEQIILRPSAQVKGDITAPRVVLEDGARFRGMVEMGEPPREERGSRPKSGATAGSDGGSSSRTSATSSGGGGGDAGKSTDATSASGSSKAGSDTPTTEPEKVGGKTR